MTSNDNLPSQGSKLLQAGEKGEKMNYPKALMSVSELTKLGFSKADLYQAIHHRMAYKYIQATKGNGKFLFDTEQWEKCRKFVLHRD